VAFGGGLIPATYSSTVILSDNLPLVCRKAKDDRDVIVAPKTYPKPRRMTEDRHFPSMFSNPRLTPGCVDSVASLFLPPAPPRTCDSSGSFCLRTKPLACLVRDPAAKKETLGPCGGAVVRLCHNNMGDVAAWQILVPTSTSTKDLRHHGFGRRLEPERLLESPQPWQFAVHQRLEPRACLADIPGPEPNITFLERFGHLPPIEDHVDVFLELPGELGPIGDSPSTAGRTAKQADQGGRAMVVESIQPVRDRYEGDSPPAARPNDPFASPNGCPTTLGRCKAAPVNGARRLLNVSVVT